MSVEVQLLDQLTAKPTKQDLTLHGPAYKSVLGRRLDAAFSAKGLAAPMVYSSEKGLVSYIPELDSAQEDQLLKKLTQPKSVRAPAAMSKPVHPTFQPTAASAASSHALFTPTPFLAGSAAQPSSSGGSGVGAAAPQPNLHPQPRKQYAASLRSEADDVREAAAKYVTAQRATMTAAQVFTWGGRFKYHGPAQPVASGARLAHQFTPGRQRAPLRLDKLSDDQAADCRLQAGDMTGRRIGRDLGGRAVGPGM